MDFSYYLFTHAGLLGTMILLIAISVLLLSNKCNRFFRVYVISRWMHIIGISILIVDLVARLLGDTSGKGVSMTLACDMVTLVITILWYIFAFHKSSFIKPSAEQIEFPKHQLLAPDSLPCPEDRSKDTLSTPLSTDSADAPTVSDSVSANPASVSADEEEDPLERIVDAWLQKRHYVNPDISINQVLSELFISSSALSNYIENVKGIKGGFRKWIQFLRIEEAKRLILSNPNVTLDSIAEQVGMSNGSALARAFKAQTDLTPSEWIRLQKKLRYASKKHNKKG